MKPKQPKLKGFTLRAMYAMLRLTRALGMASTGEKQIQMPVAARLAMRPPNWATLPLPKDVAMVVEKVDGRSAPIRIKRYIPARVNPDAPRVLFIHGGGWIHGGLDTLDHLCASVSSQAQCQLVSLEYRLAPETPFPGGFEDCDDVLNWLASTSTLGPMPKAGIAVMGESAGGNLAAALCVLSARRGSPVIAHQTLIYPALDATLASESMHTIDTPGLELRDMAKLLEVYRGEAELTDPLVSPMFAENIAQLPPALIITADVDPLRDDGARFAKKLKDAGVPTRYINYLRMPHGFFFMPRICSAAVEGISEISKEISALSRR